MRSRLFLIGIVFVLILSACQAQAQTPVTSPASGEVTSEPSPLALPTATEPGEPVEPAPTQAPTAATSSTPGETASGETLQAGCTVVSAQPTPGPEEQSMFPPVSETDWVLGPAGAPVTILEYSDFQCPYCAQLAPILDQLHERYPDQVQVVFRHLPLIGTPDSPFHDKAALGAQAAEASGLQDKFWEMHDLLFAKQSEWVNLTPDEFQPWLLEQAETLDLDAARFEQDLNSEALVQMANDAWETGQANGMVYTPLVLVNGQLWPNNLPISLENLSSIVKVKILKPRQFTACPPMEVDPAKQYIATLNTEKGDIVIELYPDKAPLAVNSFIFLAEQGWFDNVTFHRVLPGFVAQTGDPTGTGYGGPGYAFANEISEDLKFDEEGVVAMANSGPDSNGSQFFITLGPVERLNGGYTLFCPVLVGRGGVEKITPPRPSASVGVSAGGKNLSVTIDEK